MHLSFKLKKGALHDWWHGVMYQWIKHYKLLFVLAFVVVMGIGAFQWYYHLKLYSWTDEEKRVFLERTVQETSFQEKQFRQALDNLAGLSQAHEEPLPLTRDLFFGKKTKEE